MNSFAAVDLGGSSGRVAIGALREGKISMAEVHRFTHEARMTPGGLRWMWSEICSQVEQGLLKAREEAEITSIGMDSWAVDYGLIDNDGELIEEPYCYRDGRTDGLMDLLASEVGRDKIYGATGIQFMFFNTAYQLVAARSSSSYREAERFLLLPDLLNFNLCGSKSVEVTNASTTQLLKAGKAEWDWELIKQLGLREDIFPEIHEPGVTLGEVTQHGALDGVAVTSVGSHDTASAVAGAPLRSDGKSAYISSGTWSLVGLELLKPVTDERALKYNITNEIGVDNRIRFIKNVSGMWLIEESLRYWSKSGLKITSKDLAERAASLPRKQIINTNDPRFTKPGPMPKFIADFCRETNQQIPNSPEEFARCIYDSLAVSYAQSLRELQDSAQVEVEEIVIVGGGSSNRLLNQLTADETGLKVKAGPAEATLLGNIAVQMIGHNFIPSLDVARKLIADSTQSIVFKPSRA